MRAYNKYLREGVFTTEKIPEILERKNTILEALAIAKKMVKEGRYDSLDQKNLMLQSIKDGVTGLNFEDANAVIQNERLHHQKRK